VGELTRWTPEMHDALREAWPTTKVAVLAERFETSRGAIYVKANALGLPPRRGPRRPSTPGGHQRRFSGHEAPPDGPRVVLEPWHPAIQEGRTLFGKSVTPAARAERLLKSGEHSRKIGKIGTKGPWKGKPLFTLTLEERATCPRSCLEWRTCYGNNMGHLTVQRLIDDGHLHLRLKGELVHLAAVNPQGFVVRLHVLGDFFSVDYVRFWSTMLDEIAQLSIFGFTARLPGTDIGDAVVEMMQRHDARAMLRFSGGGKPLLCSEVVDSMDGAIGLPCPAQHDSERCCATCVLCATSDRTISFLRH
jgi:hypothetical protein